MTAVPPRSVLRGRCLSGSRADSPSMAVTLTSGATNVYLPNPLRDNVDGAEVHVATKRAAGGTLYAYDKGVTLRQRRLAFELRDAEKTALESFFRTTVVGPKTTFTYTDHRGTGYTARFLDTRLEFREIDDAAAGSTRFDPTGIGPAKDYPTTTRTNGFWQVEFALEVTPA